jgi:hypothetical protein
MPSPEREDVMPRMRTTMTAKVTRILQCRERKEHEGAAGSTNHSIHANASKALSWPQNGKGEWLRDRIRRGYQE